MSDGSNDVGDVQCVFNSDQVAVEWTVLEAKLEEAINAPYRATIKLRSEDPDADPTELLGKSCILTLMRNELNTDYPGIVHQVEDDAERREDGGASVPWIDITVTMSARVWLLSQNRETRIFQEKTVEEILEELLGEELADDEYEIQLNHRQSPFPRYEYRVQYDESNLDFCHRLMEEEGLLYSFEREVDDPSEAVTITSGGTSSTHLTGAAKLVISDNPHARAGVVSTDGATVDFSGGQSTRETVEAFCRSSSLQPTKLTLAHYDWTHPGLPIEMEAETEEARYEVDGAVIGPMREHYQHDSAPITCDDYDPDKGYQRDDTNAQLTVRRQLDERDAVTMRGHGTAIGFSAGLEFELAKRGALDGKYLITRVTHSYALEGESEGYSNSFRCLPAETPYRPDRQTRKPRVVGLETALVVGPNEQEIHTDKHGRVKIQFQWDREGNVDEHSSCYLRVAQPWAGQGFGFVFLPRIGMEVTVSFLHGDPDRPIITGTVYNGENTPPYTLPDDMTRSVIRTKSSKDAPEGHYNELSFEDEKGKEEVYLRAQRNLREQVLADHSTKVGKDHTLKVDEKQSITIGKQRKVEAKSQEVIITELSYHKANTYKREIANLEERIVKGKLNETVDQGVTRTVGGQGVKDTITSGGVTQTISGGLNQIVNTGGMTLKINGGGTYELSSDGPITIKSKQKITLDAPDVEIICPKEFAIKNYFKNEAMVEKGSFVSLKSSNGVRKADIWRTKVDNWDTKIENGKLTKGKHLTVKTDSKVSQTTAKVVEDRAKNRKTYDMLFQANAKTMMFDS